MIVVCKKSISLSCVVVLRRRRLRHRFRIHRMRSLPIEPFSSLKKRNRQWFFVKPTQQLTSSYRLRTIRCVRLIVVDKKSIQSPLSYRFVAVVSIDRGFVALVVLVPLRVLVLVLGVLGVLVLVLVLVVLVVLVVGIALTLIGSVVGIMITLLPIAIDRHG